MCQRGINRILFLVSNPNTYRNPAINNGENPNLTHFHERGANYFHYCDMKQVPTRIIRYVCYYFN